MPQAVTESLGDRMTTWPLSILARADSSFSLECKHTLDTFLAHTALASETICELPNVLFTNGIPKGIYSS